MNRRQFLKSAFAALAGLVAPIVQVDDEPEPEIVSETTFSEGAAYSLGVELDKEQYERYRAAFDSCECECETVLHYGICDTVSGMCGWTGEPCSLEDCPFDIDANIDCAYFGRDIADVRLDEENTPWAKLMCEWIERRVDAVQSVDLRAGSVEHRPDGSVVYNDCRLVEENDPRERRRVEDEPEPEIADDWDGTAVPVCDRCGGTGWLYDDDGWSYPCTVCGDVNPFCRGFEFEAGSVEHRPDGSVVYNDCRLVEENDHPNSLNGDTA